MFNRDLSDDWRLLSDAEHAFSGLDTLFERHKDYVFRLALGFLSDREQAEDVTQEVFLRLARGRQRFRRRGKLRTLLFQITLNTCREVRRGRARAGRLAHDLGDLANPTAPPADPRLQDLDRALAVLSERQREAVVLRYYEGLDTRETARVMGCREGSVKSHLHRAIGALRRTLASQSSSSTQSRSSTHSDKESNMKHSKTLAGAVILAVILGSGFFTTPSVGQPGGGEDEARHFIDLMGNYLNLSERWVSLASQPDTATYLAIEGITEVYENRGEKAKAIPHLLGIVEQSASNRALRNVARFKLRDLYNETGRSDKALEQLELIIRENTD